MVWIIFGSVKNWKYMSFTFCIKLNALSMLCVLFLYHAYTFWVQYEGLYVRWLKYFKFKAVFGIISVFYADHLYHLFANPNSASFLKIIKLVKIKLLLKSGKKF